MKIEKIELTSKDVEILNKIKKFLNKPDSELDPKDLAAFNRVIKWINRWFTIQEPKFPNRFMGFDLEPSKPTPRLKPRQKMGHGTITGLSGCTWDLSKMPADEAEAFKRDIERDIKHDKMMHPEKYLYDKIYRRESDEFSNSFYHLPKKPHPECKKQNSFEEEFLNELFQILIKVLKNKLASEVSTKWNNKPNVDCIINNIDKILEKLTKKEDK